MNLSEWSQLLTVLLLLVTIVWMAFASFYTGTEPRRERALIALFIAAALLRVLYVYATPYDVRSYDVDGHLEYVTYLVDHYALPPFDGGWEFYQAPLYYMFAALWWSAGMLLGHGEDLLIGGLQIFSLLLSLVTLRIIFCIGSILWREQNSTYAEILFDMSVAFFPGIVMLASRISNDTLAFLTSTVALALLLRWWKRPAIGGWVWFCVAVGFGLLSKSTATLLLAAGFACLPFAKPLPWFTRIWHGLVGLIVILLIAGWHTIPRALEQMDAGTYPVGNAETLNPDMLVDESPSSYLVFHPVAVLLDPFNDTWTDEHGRDFFWDFFYKSAFFGEFQHADQTVTLASVILLLGMLVLLLVPVGIVADLWKRSVWLWPLLMCSGAVLAGQILLRMKLPYSPSQDFRFSLLLAVTTAYFAARGALSLPRLLRGVSFDLLSALVVLEVGFVLLLTVTVPVLV